MSNIMDYQEQDTLTKKNTDIFELLTKIFTLDYAAHQQSVAILESLQDIGKKIAANTQEQTDVKEQQTDHSKKTDDNNSLWTNIINDFQDYLTGNKSIYNTIIQRQEELLQDLFFNSDEMDDLNVLTAFPPQGQQIAASKFLQSEIKRDSPFAPPLNSMILKNQNVHDPFDQTIEYAIELLIAERNIQEEKGQTIIPSSDAIAELHNKYPKIAASLNTKITDIIYQEKDWNASKAMYQFHKLIASQNVPSLPSKRSDTNTKIGSRSGKNKHQNEPQTQQKAREEDKINQDKKPVEKEAQECKHEEKQDEKSEKEKKQMSLSKYIPLTTKQFPANIEKPLKFIEEELKLLDQNIYIFQSNQKNIQIWSQYFTAQQRFEEAKIDKIKVLEFNNNDQKNYYGQIYNLIASVYEQKADNWNEVWPLKLPTRPSSLAIPAGAMVCNIITMKYNEFEVPETEENQQMEDFFNNLPDNKSYTYDELGRLIDFQIDNDIFFDGINANNTYTNTNKALIVPQVHMNWVTTRNGSESVFNKLFIPSCKHASHVPLIANGQNCEVCAEPIDRVEVFDPQNFSNLYGFK